MSRLYLSSHLYPRFRFLVTLTSEVVPNLPQSSAITHPYPTMTYVCCLLSTSRHRKGEKNSPTTIFCPVIDEFLAISTNACAVSSRSVYLKNQQPPPSISRSKLKKLTSRFETHHFLQIRPLFHGLNDRLWVFLSLHPAPRSLATFLPSILRSPPTTLDTSKSKSKKKPSKQDHSPTPSKATRDKQH